MSQKFETDTPTIDEIRRLRTPNRRSIELYLDNVLNAEIRELESEIGIQERVDGRSNETDLAPAMKDKLEELREEAAKALIVFTFEDIGNMPFQDLIGEHKPTAEQLVDEPELEWNPMTFPPALMARSAVQPKLTLNDAQALWEEWSVGDNQALFTTALLANTDRSAVNFTGSGIEGILDLLSSSTSPPNGESRTRSSKAAKTDGLTTTETSS